MRGVSTWKLLGRWTVSAALGIVILFAAHDLAMRNLLDQPEAGYIQLINHFHELTDPTVKADLVIIGTSHSAHGINPRFLENDGLKVYNFGLSGAGPKYYFEWYTHLLRRYYPRPRYMIVGVDWFIFDDKYLYRKLENDLAYMPWKAVFDKTLDRSFPVPPDIILRNKFGIMANKEQLLGGIFQNLPGAHPIRGFYKGYMPLAMPYGGCNGKPANYEGLTISPKAVKDLKRLLDVLREDGIRLVLVQTPELLSCRVADGKSQERLSEIIGEMGVTYLNYNADRVSEINNNPYFFSTWGHLSEAGSKAFSLRLRRDLEALVPQIYEGRD